MLHLIKLEMKRYKLRGPLKTFAIASIIILGLILLMGYTADEGPVFRDYTEAFNMIEVLVGATFVVLASVMLSRLVVDEYRNRTITILFTYPVNRKKLLLSKLLIVSGLTFIFIVISDILISAFFCYFNDRWVILPEPLTAEIIGKQMLHLFVKAAAFAGIALIPLYFGMRKKSVPATIISSILIVLALSSGNNGSNLSAFIAIPVILGFIGVLIGYMSICKVEHVDL